MQWPKTSNAVNRNKKMFNTEDGVLDKTLTHMPLPTF